MSRLTRTLWPALTCWLLTATPAQADTVMAVKIGHMRLDMPAAAEPDNLALMLGYSFDTMIADLSLVGEISRSFNSGRTVAGGDLEVGTEALYLVYRSTSTLYITLRGGIAREEIAAGSSRYRDSDVSYSAGLGVVVGRTRWQIELTTISNGTGFLSLGVEYD